MTYLDIRTRNRFFFLVETLFKLESCRTSFIVANLIRPKCCQLGATSDGRTESVSEINECPFASQETEWEGRQTIIPSKRMMTPSWRNAVLLL